MKKFFISYFFILCFLVHFSYSQNLVPNGSFEDTLACPTERGQINYSTGWFTPISTSPDYFNACANIISDVGIPKNIFGYQYAHTGVAYAGFIGMVIPGASYREYIETKLIDSMQANKRYCIEFYASLANISYYAIDNIGAYLTKMKVINMLNDTILIKESQINNMVGNIISDTLNWIKISGDYTAFGGEKWITIGNFKYSAQTMVDTLDSGTDLIAYYYIDDVSVTLCDSSDTTGIAENENIADRFFVHPNPNNGNMQLDYKIPEQQQGVFEIYDLTGRILKTYTLTGGNTQMNISEGKLSQGIYFYQVILNGKRIANDKLVIIKN